MKKHSTEIKVGVIITLSLIVFIWLFNYVKGINLLKPSHSYYVVYNDINGLKKSSAVFVNGYKVGLVDDIEFTHAVPHKLVVRILLEENLSIPDDSKAVLINTDIMSTKAIRIDEGESSRFLNYGDTLHGTVEPSLMDEISQEIIPLKEKTEHLVVTLDSLATAIQGMLNDNFRENVEGSMQDLRVTMSHLRRVSYSLDTMVTRQDGQVQTILSGVNANLHKLDHVMANLTQVSDSLSQADITALMDNLNKTLKGTSLLMERINNGEGSLGKLTTNDSLYLAIQSLTMRLDTLVTKITENPKKYIRVKLF